MRKHGLLSIAILFTVGCASFDGAAVRERQQQLEETYSVTVDVTEASPLLGDTMNTLRRIEKALEVFPDGYRRKIATINVVEDFFGRFGLMSSGVGAYTEDEIPEHYRQVFVKNRSFLEDVMGVMSMDTSLHIEHEAWHSVEYYEIQLIETMIRERARDKVTCLWDLLKEVDEVLANLSPSEVASAVNRAPTTHGRAQLRTYVWLIRGWLAAHFGDVDKSGTVDDADMRHVYANRTRYDADGDGRLTYRDVKKLTGFAYLEAENPLDPVLQLGLTVGMFGIHAPGYVTFYAQNFTYEDRAEVVDRLAAWKLVPHVYGTGDAARTRAAWKRFERLRRSDPVAARKVELILRYIALHEDPADLNDRWQRAFGIGTVPGVAAGIPLDPAAASR